VVRESLINNSSARALAIAAQRAKLAIKPFVFPASFTIAASHGLSAYAMNTCRTIAAQLALHIARCEPHEIISDREERAGL
jgi:hypothetical protein